MSDFDRTDDSGLISPPTGGWAGTTFICIFPPKTQGNAVFRPFPSFFRSFSFEPHPQTWWERLRPSNFGARLWPRPERARVVDLYR